MDQHVEHDPAIDPADGTIRGTGIEAHRIAALMAGPMTRSAILRDYPELTDALVEAAVRYARAQPWGGRGFPDVTAKEAMRASRLHALDEPD